ncbi:hypothetical protein ABZ864_47250 [Streptomyces sp. NPDC047082]|uniref:hypothetical protein n=1 Tax=Streptomyces sp. NPDC047082 TaxID=3155259 RepID=UPI0033F041F1
MDSTIWAALIGAAASIVLFVGGAAASTFKDRAADRTAASNAARAAVQELMAASLDVKAALAIWETRWRDKRNIASALAQSATQILAGYAENRVYRGAAEGLSSAMAWRRAADAAEEAIVTGPLSRMAAAAARIAMLDDPALREASTAVTDALGRLVEAYSERARSAARQQADSAVDEAVARLGEAARSHDGRPARRMLPPSRS